MPSPTIAAPAKTPIIPSQIQKYAILAAQIAVLLFSLRLNRKIGNALPLLWFLVPLTLTAFLSRATIDATERPAVRLWQLIGCLSACYGLIHYPLIPVDGNRPGLSGFLYFLLICGWAISILSGILCFKIPSLSLVPPAFLVWSNSIAIHNRSADNDRPRHYATCRSIPVYRDWNINQSGYSDDPAIEVFRTSHRGDGNRHPEISSSGVADSRRRASGQLLLVIHRENDIGRTGVCVANTKQRGLFILGSPG